jgi:hypothetical protein
LSWRAAVLGACVSASTAPGSSDAEPKTRRSSTRPRTRFATSASTRSGEGVSASDWLPGCLRPGLTLERVPAFYRQVVGVERQGMDEQTKLRMILDACHRVLAQLRKIHAGEDNPFAKRIRETCRDAMARLATVQSTSSWRAGSARGAAQSQPLPARRMSNSDPNSPLS